MKKILAKFDLSVDELNEYKRLQRSIFGVGLFKSLFVEMDFKTPAHKRLNELTGKILPLKAYLVNHRNEDDCKLLIEVLC